MSITSDDAERENAVRQSGVLNNPRDPELVSIVGLTAVNYRAPLAGLSIITGTRAVFVASMDTSVVEICKADTFCATGIQHPGEVLVVPDALDEPRFLALPLVKNSPFIRFYAGVPIIDRSGYALGVLWVADKQPRHHEFDPSNLLIRGREVERYLRW